MESFISRLVTLLLVATLCGTPELLSATMLPQSSTQEQPQSAGQEAQVPAAQQPTANPQPQDPQAQPQPDTTPAATPLNDPQPLPDAPSASQSSTQIQQDSAPQETETPVGTAAAKAGNVKGGPASKPAGAAIAPAKQRQTRSLLIKIGLIAGAGVALGTVFALSRGSPSRPPGSQ